MVQQTSESLGKTSEDMAAPDPRVLVAVLTFGRAELLPRLLDAVLAQRSQLQPSADLIVVDNDPRGSARDVVADQFAGRVGYVLHGARGIAEGRNRILDEAAGYDCLILIDDDEVPSTNWLRNLVDTYLGHTCAAVVGPQLREYETEPTPRVAAARVSFDQPVFPTGTPMPAAATNNLLLDLTVVRDLGLRFDPRFSVTGGSDTMFTRQLVRAGQRIVWCQEAAATEWVPVSRLTMQWVWTRSMRSGMTWARTGIALQQRPARRATVRLVGLGRGLTRVLGGTLRAGLGAARRRDQMIGSGLRTQARGVGMIAGSLGIHYKEYRSVQQSVSGRS